MDIIVDPLSDDFQDWLDRHQVPPPHMGGAFAYCPHLTPQVVKQPKKKAVTVHVKCTFKTRRIRRYARHYRRRHGPQAEQAVTLAQADARIEEVKAGRKRTPRFAKGDFRRKDK